MDSLPKWMLSSAFISMETGARFASLTDIPSSQSIKNFIDGDQKQLAHLEFDHFDQPMITTDDINNIVLHYLTNNQITEAFVIAHLLEKFQ